jgi:hypothetical protein
MRRIGAFLAFVAVAAVLNIPSPSAAFGLRLGPLYFGLPFFGHRHRHGTVAPASSTAGLHDEANLDAVAPERAEREPALPLLYPGAALPAVYDEIFWSSSAPWPFSYEAIFQTAFAKADAAQLAGACQEPDRGRAVVEHIKNEIRPSGVQAQQLQRLAGALGMASGYLAKACPNDIPPQPVARLQQMEWQVEKLAQALDIVRQPLQDFEQSLNATQRARLAGSRSTAAAAIHPDRRANIAAFCASSPTSVDASMERISLSVQPTEAQRDAVSNIKQAFGTAAAELDANCPSVVAPDPLARLEATEARLDATWRAVVAIQVALADFDKGLSDEQRARLDATDFAAAQ